MSGLPVEVRDRAVSTLLDMYGSRGTGTWRTLAEHSVDAVAEVLAEHQPKVDLEHPDPSRRMSFEQSMSSIEARFGKALDVLDRIDRLEAKLSKQRRRRKAAEARVLELEAELDRISNGWASRIESRRAVESERDALQARVGNLRAALESFRVIPGTSSGWSPLADSVAAALAADDRAAGRTEEKT